MSERTHELIDQAKKAASWLLWSPWRLAAAVLVVILAVALGSHAASSIGTDPAPITSTASASPWATEGPERVLPSGWPTWPAVTAFDTAPTPAPTPTVTPTPTSTPSGEGT